MNNFVVGDTVYIKPEYEEHFKIKENHNPEINTPYTVTKTSPNSDLISIDTFGGYYYWRFMSKEEWLKTKNKSIYADGSSPMQGDIVECVVKDGDYEKLVIGKHYTVHSVERDLGKYLVNVDLDEPHLKNIGKWAYKFKLVKRENEMTKQFNKDIIPVGSVVLAKHKIVADMDYEGEYETDIGYVSKDDIVEVISEPPFNPEVGDKVWIKGRVRGPESKIVKAIIETTDGPVYVTQFCMDAPQNFKLYQLERW